MSGKEQEESWTMRWLVEDGSTRQHECVLRKGATIQCSMSARGLKLVPAPLPAGCRCFWSALLLTPSTGTAQQPPVASHQLMSCPIDANPSGSRGHQNVRDLFLRAHASLMSGLHWRRDSAVPLSLTSPVPVAATVAAGDRPCLDTPSLRSQPIEDGGQAPRRITVSHRLKS